MSIGIFTAEELTDDLVGKMVVHVEAESNHHDYILPNPLQKVDIFILNFIKPELHASYKYSIKGIRRYRTKYETDKNGRCFDSDGNPCYVSRYDHDCFTDEYTWKNLKFHIELDNT